MTLRELERQVKDKENKIKDENFRIKDNILQDYIGDKDTSTLIIPEGIKYITDLAIHDLLKLENIVFPISLESIGFNSFVNLPSLKEINLKENVKSVSITSFTNCENLQNINVSENNPYIKSIDGALYTKDGRELLKVPQRKEGVFKIPDGVIKIENTAFNSCTKITNIEFPESFRRLCYYAFSNCPNIKRLYLPSRVEQLYEREFVGLKGLEEVVISRDNPYYKSIDGVVYSKDGKTLIYIPEGRTKAYTVPPCVQEVEGDIFSFLKLDSLTFPKNIRIDYLYPEIRKFVFSPRIKEIYFLNKNGYVNCDLFYDEEHFIKNYKGLYPTCIDESYIKVFLPLASKEILNNKEVSSAYKARWLYYIKENIKNLRYLILKNEDVLQLLVKSETLTLKDTLYLIEENTSSYDSNLTASSILLEYQNNHFTIEQVEKEKERAMEATIEESYTRIKEYEYIENPTYISITSYIGKDKDIIVPDIIRDKEVKEIKKGSFSPLNKELKERAKAERLSINSIVLPDTVEKIEDGAFWGMEKLSSITLSDNIKEIGDENKKGMFYNCFALNDLTLPRNLIKINNNGLRHSFFTNVTLPSSLQEIGEYAFCSCGQILQIEIPSKIKEIKSHCFSTCEKLQEVVIGENVEKIGESAFCNCPSLQKVVIKNPNIDISFTSFFPTSDIALYGPKGSNVEKYCYRRQIRFIPLEEKKW